MRILVTGLLTYDSGKTEFILSLINILRNRGLKPGYFKPVAGHDGWYQYDTIYNSIERRLLIGHDAFIVGNKLDLIDKLHIVSPLDILTLPVDLSKIGFNTYLYEDYMTSVSKRMVLARFTRVFSSIHNYRNVYFVCKDTANRLSNELKNVLDLLISNLETENSLFIKTSSINVEKLLSNPYIYDIIDSYLVFLKDYEPIIIEGYNDVASPTRASLFSDIAIVVAPGKAFIYNGSRYRTAVELLSYRGHPWSIRVRSVVEICGKPLGVFDIPFKTSIDKLNKVFEEIIEFIYKYSKGEYI